MFEISPFQLETLSNVINETFIQMTPDAQKDDPETLMLWHDHTKAVLELVHEGFLNDITDMCSEYVKRMKDQTGREFRAYEMTPMAKMMFLNPRATSGVPN